MPFYHVKVALVPTNAKVEPDDGICPSMIRTSQHDVANSKIATHLALLHCGVDPFTKLTPILEDYEIDRTHRQAYESRIVHNNYEPFPMTMTITIRVF